MDARFYFRVQRTPCRPPLGEICTPIESFARVLKTCGPLAIHLHAGIDASDLAPKASVDFPAKWAEFETGTGHNALRILSSLCCVCPPSVIPPLLQKEDMSFTPRLLPRNHLSFLPRSLTHASPSYQTPGEKDQAADLIFGAIEEYVRSQRPQTSKPEMGIHCVAKEST